MSVKFPGEERAMSRLDELHRKEEEQLAQILSHKYGIPYADLSRVTIDTDGLRIIPEEEARKAKIAIFDLVGKHIRIAVLAPGRDDTQAVIKDLENRGYLTESYMVSNQGLDRAWERYKEISFASTTKEGTLDIASEDIEEFVSKVQKIEDVKTLVAEIMQMKKSFRISRIVEIVMASAIALGASDVHVEPEKETIRLRMRLDGVLVEIINFDKDTYKLLLSRIKLLSGMKLSCIYSNKR